MNANDRRNFGFGRQLYWAGEQALRKTAEEDGGRYGWLHTTLYRWEKFCDFCSEQGVVDARDITFELVEKYSATLLRYSASTQQNYLSALNGTMVALAGPEWQPISPSKVSGTRRRNVRARALILARINIDEVAWEIDQSVGLIYSFAVQVAFQFGLRRREALLFEFHVAKRQIRQSGYIDVIRGTKGGRGRSVQRLIPVSNDGYQLVQQMCNHFPEHRCLLLDGTYKSTSAKLSSEVLPILKQNGIRNFHELRAAYACRRYIEITGLEPPCNQPINSPNIEVDRNARAVIALELGHSRIDILNAYVGSNHENGSGTN